MLEMMARHKQQKDISDATRKWARVVRLEVLRRMGGETISRDKFAEQMGEPKDIVEHLKAGVTSVANTGRLSWNVGSDTMTPFGGVFAGTRVLVTRNLPANTVLFLDAPGLIMALTDVEVDVAQADIQQDSAPTGNTTSPTATSLTSGFGLSGILRSVVPVPMQPIP